MNNKYDVFEWVKKVIDSCETPRQKMKCYNLVENFHVMYGDYDLTAHLYNYK